MKDLKQIFSKTYTREYFSRNKNLIILSLIIFIGSIIIGAVFNKSFEAIVTEIIRQMLNEISMESVSENAVSLFVNNITANLVILAGGIIFSLLSVFAIIVNGILIGYVYTLTTPLIFLVGTVPHGIFEITALILSLTGAFIITKTELLCIQALFAGNLSSQVENMKICFKDIIFTIVVSFVLLVFAAIIEAAVTPLLLSMVV
ncbi:MAG: stage II sporulation protein M [Methanosphaera sp.]|nr:stage II sporulation protein M [Methanosphaera sp.]